MRIVGKGEEGDHENIMCSVQEREDRRDSAMNKEGNEGAVKERKRPE